MIHLESFIKAIKTKFIQSLLLNHDSANWKVIPHFYFHQYGRDFLVFYMDIPVFKNLPKLKHKFPKFYEDLINIWVGFRNITHVNNKSKRCFTYDNSFSGKEINERQTRKMSRV